MAQSLPSDLRSITPEWLTEVLSVRHPGVVCSEVAVGTVVEGAAIKGSYRQHLWHGFVWWLCPLEMQPDATSRAYGKRLAPAVMDLDAFAAIA